MESLLMKADLTDLASGKLEKLKKNVKGVEGGSTALKAAFGDLTAKANSLGVPLDKLEQYFGKLPKGMIGAGAAIGTVVAGLGALAMHSIKVGADLQDMSDTTGLSVEHLSSMRNVLAASNMDVKGYSDAISKLSVRLADNGQAFAKQGIDITSSESAFDSIKRKIADTEDPIKRVKLANEAFGKSYKDLMPLLTMANGEYDKMRGNTSVFSSEFAANAAKVDDNIALLKTTFSDFAVQLGANFIPMMEKIVGLFGDAANYWGMKANGSDPNDYGTTGMVVKMTGQSRVGTQDLSTSNFGTEDAQSQLKAMSSAQLMELSVWAQIEKKNTELSKKILEVREKRLDEEEKARELLQEQFDARATANKLTQDLQNAKDLRDKLIQETSYETFLKNKENQEFKDQRGVSNQSRYDAQFGASVDMYGGNDTAFRDAQEDRNNGVQKGFNRQRYQEHELDLKAQDEEQKRIDALVFQQTLEDQNEALDRQLQIYEAIAGKVENVLISPMEDFYKHIGSANKDLLSNFGSLFSGIQDAFGNMLAQMAAQLTAKAAIFGVLNLLSGGGVGFATSALSKFSWFANGTDYAYGGPALVGDRGPEYINLPRGASVTPASNVSPTYNINITNNQGNLDPEEIIRQIRLYEKTKGR